MFGGRKTTISLIAMALFGLIAAGPAAAEGDGFAFAEKLRQKAVDKAKGKAASRKIKRIAPKAVAAPVEADVAVAVEPDVANQPVVFKKPKKLVSGKCWVLQYRISYSFFQKNF